MDNIIWNTKDTLYSPKDKDKILGYFEKDKLFSILTWMDSFKEWIVWGYILDNNKSEGLVGRALLVTSKELPDFWIKFDSPEEA